MTEAEYLLLAADPSCTGEELERFWDIVGAWDFPLGVAAGVRIQHQIAKNPNLTATLASRCLGQLSPSLMENPVLPLLLMESPRLAEDAPVETLLRMTRRLSSPPELLRVLTQHSRPQIAEAARLHLSLYGEASAAQVAEELLALKAGGKANLEALHSWGLMPPWLVAHHKLRAPKPPVFPPQIEGSVNDEPLTPEEHSEVEQLIWNERNLSFQERWERRNEIPSYINVPYRKAEALRMLVESDRSLVGSVLSNPSAPLDLLQRFGADTALLARADVPLELKREAAIRQVASGATVGLAVVLSLAHAVGEALLHEAALSTRWLRRLGVALNPNTAPADQERLREDANALVRAVARDAALREQVLKGELGWSH